jgi:hypothetical protein
LSFTARRTLAVPSAELGTLSGNPRRTPYGKEEREGLLLEELRKTGRLDFPKGLIRRGDDHTGKGPDFVIESLSGRTVAIEVTELFLDVLRSPREGSPEREQEGLREQFVRKAEQAFYEKVPYGRAANVSFHWLPRV